MGKNMNFSGQPIFNQLLNFIDKNEIKQIAKKHEAERYVKKFTTYHHLVVMLYASIEGYHSIRETILGLLANARRTSGVFEDIYMSVCRKYANFLADSRLKDADM
jgi:hypothetical protein